jgi:hypothetical protein
LQAFVGESPEIVVIGPGLALLFFYSGPTPAWFKRHVLPDFFVPRAGASWRPGALRLPGLASRRLIVWVRPWLGACWSARPSARAPGHRPDLVAWRLAVVAAELIVERLPWRAPSPGAGRPRAGAPLGRPPRLALCARPHGHGLIGGRDVAIRLRRGRPPGALARPSRSTTPRRRSSSPASRSWPGHGLFYDETIGARRGAATGYQTANLAVGGYATDQAYLRLKEEWPAVPPAGRRWSCCSRPACSSAAWMWTVRT